MALHFARIEHRTPQPQRDRIRRERALTALSVLSGQDQAPELMTPAEVAELFRVDPKTVSRWAKVGRLNSVKTLGGHRRFLASEIEALLNGRSPRAPTPD